MASASEINVFMYIAKGIFLLNCDVTKKLSRCVFNVVFGGFFSLEKTHFELIQRTFE